MQVSIQRRTFFAGAFVAVLLVGSIAGLGIAPTDDRVESETTGPSAAEHPPTTPDDTDDESTVSNDTGVVEEDDTREGSVNLTAEKGWHAMHNLSFSDEALTFEGQTSEFIAGNQSAVTYIVENPTSEHLEVTVNITVMDDGERVTTKTVTHEVAAGDTLELTRVIDLDEHGE